MKNSIRLNLILLFAILFPINSLYALASISERERWYKREVTDALRNIASMDLFYIKWKLNDSLQQVEWATEEWEETWKDWEPRPGSKAKQKKKVKPYFLNENSPYFWVCDQIYIRARAIKDGVLINKIEKESETGLSDITLGDSFDFLSKLSEYANMENGINSCFYSPKYTPDQITVSNLAWDEEQRVREKVIELYKEAIALTKKGLQTGDFESLRLGLGRARGLGRAGEKPACSEKGNFSESIHYFTEHDVSYYDDTLLGQSTGFANLNAQVPGHAENILKVIKRRYMFDQITYRVLAISNGIWEKALKKAQADPNRGEWESDYKKMGRFLSDLTSLVEEENIYHFNGLIQKARDKF